MSPTVVCAAYTQTLSVTTSAVIAAPVPTPPAGKRSKGKRIRNRGGRDKSSSCNYAAAFGDAVAAEFESASGLFGTEPLGNVLDSVLATGTGGCPSIGDQFATVVLTYKPESTPVDPVAYAAAAQAWLADEPFSMTIDVCGCTATVALTDTASGYTGGFTEKGTPKTGKCKGGYSSLKSSPKKKSGKKMTSVLESVGAPGTSVVIATAVAGIAGLVAIVALVAIKRRTTMARLRSEEAEPLLPLL
jgi:hypothetical protein